MSGKSEIERWFDDNEEDFELTPEMEAEALYDLVNARFTADNRNDLDSILLDEKEEFLDFLAGKIAASEPFEEEEDPIQAGMVSLFG